jgi:hypothetical protein
MYKNYSGGKLFRVSEENVCRSLLVLTVRKDKSPTTLLSSITDFGNLVCYPKTIGPDQPD